jgi:hypothetical protein
LLQEEEEEEKEKEEKEEETYRNHWHQPYLQSCMHTYNIHTNMHACIHKFMHACIHTNT